jgi:hypothetical protein
LVNDSDYAASSSVTQPISKLLYVSGIGCRFSQNAICIGRFLLLRHPSWLVSNKVFICSIHYVLKSLKFPGDDLGKRKATDMSYISVALFNTSSQLSANQKHKNNLT